MSPMPGGTVTFLFTDIEGSTKLWEQHPDAMRTALARHDELLRQAIEDNEGVVFKTIGDAVCAAFATAPDALNAALAAQCSLHSEHWPDALSLRVRMALHTGATELRDNDYFGQPLNRVARLLAIGHGGQALLSLPTEELVRDTLPSLVSLHNVGPHRLRDLGRPETVFQLLHPDLPSEFPPLRSLDNPELPNNLPRQVTSFIGREKEIGAVKSLLGKTRLLTLTGSGGCGKTRLALQVAADVLENYADGAWFVELAPLADPALVPQSVASALRVTEEAGKPLVQTLVAALKDRKMLLILDNCEHVLDACARLVDTLLHTCPTLKVLASSREGLGIGGELTYRTPSLSLPDLKQTATVESVGQYEAVELFVERALFHLPAFAVTNDNAPALASVCHRLDGIPLALELAAARVRSLSVEEINSKLDNRFRLLTGGSRTALPRHQTLRALIDWSYDLLNVQEKALLCRLSVFAGGWTLAAAEQVGTGASIEAWEVLDLLTSLADKSLVLAQPQGEVTRYRLLETVRQYARDCLAKSGESLLVRARHTDYFLTLAEEAAPKLKGSEQAQWIGVLEEEHDNLRQALAFYIIDVEETEGGVKGLRLGAALQQFWATRGHLSEGRERLRTLLAHPGGQEPTKARADALRCAGILAYFQGGYAQAHALHEESLAIRRELGDKAGIAYSLTSLGLVAQEQSDYASARSLHEESLAIKRELGDKSGIANSLRSLGIAAYEQGDYASARVLFEESLAIEQELGDKSGIANSLINLGNLTYYLGDYTQARSLHEESLAITQELGDRRQIAYNLEAFAFHAVKEAQEERSVRLWGAAATLRETIGSPLSPFDGEKQEREMAAVRKTLGEDAFAVAWAQGRTMTTEQAIEYALNFVSDSEPD
jgi:predicted ATPase/class 3 adenylate cyclase